MEMNNLYHYSLVIMNNKKLNKSMKIKFKIMIKIFNNN